MTSIEENRKSELDQARRAQPGNMSNRAMSTYNMLSNPLGSAVDMGMNLVNERFEKKTFKRGPYIIAAIAAVFKDLLDLGFIGSFPGVGTVLTLLTSILIGLMLIMAGGYSKKNAAIKTIKKFFILFAGTLAEVIFGLNFLPMETLTVGIIYWMSKKEEKQNAKIANEMEKTEVPDKRE